MKEYLKNLKPPEPLQVIDPRIWEKIKEDKKEKKRRYYEVFNEVFAFCSKEGIFQDDH